MSTFPRTVVQSAPAGLRVYRVVALDAIQHMFQDGGLRLQGHGPGQWSIALREKLSDALDRGIYTGATKQTHVVLDIQFSPLGVAHYTTLCQGPSYSYQPTLQKMTYRGDKDWKVWHFHGDLPLQAEDEQGNSLVTSGILEIM